MDSLFAPDLAEAPVKPAGDRPEKMRVLITAKAAPQPSSTYGETVCVAGLRLDLEHQGWVRLYPINFRSLETNEQFKKYDVIVLDARPSHSHDPRPESWRPILPTIASVKSLNKWKARSPYIDHFIEGSMCKVLGNAKSGRNYRSLTAIRPKEIKGIEVEAHPGWTVDEQKKIDRYVAQPEITAETPPAALKAPRFKAWYKYRCADERCKGHRQGILDWEFVALQIRFRGLGDSEMKDLIEKKFFDGMCSADKDTVFYVGNQAKRPHVFSVLGVYYPSLLGKG